MASRADAAHQTERRWLHWTEVQDRFGAEGELGAAALGEWQRLTGAMTAEEEEWLRTGPRREEEETRPAEEPNPVEEVRARRRVVSGREAVEYEVRRAGQVRWEWERLPPRLTAAVEAQRRRAPMQPDDLRERLEVEALCVLAHSRRAEARQPRHLLGRQVRPY